MQTTRQRNTPSRDIDAEIGRRAHMLMWDAKRKQGEVAEQIGIHSDSLSRKLKGTTGWAASELVAIAGVLGTSVSYLVGEAEDPHPGMGGGLRGSLPGLDSNQEPAG